MKCGREPESRDCNPQPYISSLIFDRSVAGKALAATPSSAVESVPRNYHKIISENKDVTRGMMMLGGCVQTVKNYVAKALADCSHFSFLYLEDKEKFVEVPSCLLFSSRDVKVSKPDWS